MKEAQKTIESTEAQSLHILIYPLPDLALLTFSNPTFLTTINPKSALE